MTPEEALKAGQLKETLQLLTAQVRNNPADARRRVFLFQLLAVLGQWERAQNQLKVAGELDPANALLTGAYGKCLEAERVRAAVFAGSRLPVVVGEPEQWLALLLQALKFTAEGRHEEATTLRKQAFDQAPATAGAINEVPFEWLADADPRLGPCLEVVINGGYSWVPFSRIGQLKFEAPSDLRDKVWTAVQITWSNGGEAVGFVPTRYPGSEASGDDAVALAAKTEWREAAPGQYLGQGQRLLATDVGEYPLLDVRLISFDPS